jgi:hypothetical protein
VKFKLDENVPVSAAAILTSAGRKVDTASKFDCRTGGDAIMADEPDQGALSLEQIEQDFWGEASADASRLIRTAHQLRGKPVHALTAEVLRQLISQEIGVEALVPRAIALLRQDH